MSVNRAARLFHLISILRTGRGYTGSELADVAGVSQRTIYRDVVDLSDLVPIYYDEGYRLLSESFLANLTFTREELLALKLGVQMQAVAQGSYLGAATNSALAKIEEQLIRRCREPDANTDTITVHVKAHPLSDKNIKTLRVLENAIRARKTVRLNYYSLNRYKKTRRSIDPYGLTFRGHSWYLVGHCHLRRTIRVFRLDRILTVERSPSRFERPEDFSIEEFFADTWETFSAEHKAKVVLRFNQSAEPIAKPMLAGRGKFRKYRDPKIVVFEGEIPLSDEFCRWLLTLSGEVEVLEPLELREKVAEKHREAAALYAPARDRKAERGCEKPKIQTPARVRKNRRSTT
ncbi:MAG: YafY family protein [bacterium]